MQLLQGMLQLCQAHLQAPPAPPQGVKVQGQEPQMQGLLMKLLQQLLLQLQVTYHL